jgi:hypothetical protein
VNDIRQKLGENPVPKGDGGDVYHMNGTFVPLSTTPPEPAQASGQEPPNDEPADTPTQVM